MEQNNYDNPFLGGLKSELDEGFELDVIFNTLIAVADNIRNRYIKYEISGEQAATLFKKLRVVDVNNNQWTIGPSSGSWYIKTNNNTIWSQSNPPIGIEVENPDTYSFDQLVSHEEIEENKSSINKEDYDLAKQLIFKYENENKSNQLPMNNMNHMNHMNHMNTMNHTNTMSTSIYK